MIEITGKVKSKMVNANSRAYRYMEEIQYSRDRVDSLIDFLGSEKISKPRRLLILDEISTWRKRIKAYEYYIDTKL